RAYVYAMLILAVWGILEFATGLHVWENWMPSSSHTFNALQERAGIIRSEASFGHAIAYGAAIAMALPLAKDLQKHPLLAQAVLIAGVVVSFSRGPILAMALTVGLSVFIGARGRNRVVGLFVTAVAMVAVALAFQFLYGEDDSATTALSGEQRWIQLFATLPHVQWFGSESISVEDGRIQTMGADLIDSTFLRLGVNFGWIVAALVLSPLIYAVARMLTGRSSPASIALIGQIPVLAVTTLITQWQATVFFVAGLAVADLVARRTAERTPAAHTPERYPSAP
ncbi:hypothetical protein ACWGR3_31205, partial [Streptomyces albidoflavus]